MTALEHTLHAALIQAAKIISDHGAASLAQRAQIFAALQQGFDAGGNHADNDHHRSSGGNAIVTPRELGSDRGWPLAEYLRRRLPNS